jgi:hypothetical protein
MTQVSSVELEKILANLMRACRANKFSTCA